ncbi:MAG: hypothetical protein Q4P66_01280 [Actinomycetaceae bacterium]|nr:hypothetical protein [Actinomycetaceae bacterium]
MFGYYGFESAAANASNDISVLVDRLYSVQVSSAWAGRACEAAENKVSEYRSRATALSLACPHVIATSHLPPI